MKTVFFLVALLGFALAEPEGASRDASSNTRSQSGRQRQGHFVPVHDRPSTVVIKYTIPNHRAKTVESPVTVTRTEHHGFSRTSPRFRNAPLAEEDELKEEQKEESLLKSDSTIFSRTKKPVLIELDDTPLPEKKVKSKSKDDETPTLRDFGKKPFDDIAKDDSVPTETKASKEAEASAPSGPSFRVFPYLLIGRTTSGTEFPFLAMLRESKSNANEASENPFIPAFVAMNPEDHQPTATRQAAVPNIDPFPSPPLHPELLRAMPESPRLTPSPHEFLRTAERPEEERPHLVAAPIFNLPLPPMESLVRENVMSNHPSNFLRGHEPEMQPQFEMPRRPRFLPEFERQPPPPPHMFERDPRFERPRFFPERRMPMHHF